MFSQNIKNLRILNDLTQQELSVKLNVSRTTVSAWENGLTEPDLETLRNLKYVLNATYEDLLED